MPTYRAFIHAFFFTNGPAAGPPCGKLAHTLHQLACTICNRAHANTVCIVFLQSNDTDVTDIKPVSLNPVMHVGRPAGTRIQAGHQGLQFFSSRTHICAAMHNGMREVEDSRARQIQKNVGTGKHAYTKSQVSNNHFPSARLDLLEINATHLRSMRYLGQNSNGMSLPLTP